jgi:hypothetical protein
MSARVVFLNEQTSHHPPISHFMLESRGPKGRVRCVGADQLSAKVSFFLPLLLKTNRAPELTFCPSRTVHGN